MEQNANLHPPLGEYKTNELPTAPKKKVFRLTTKDSLKDSPPNPGF